MPNDGRGVMPGCEAVHMPVDWPIWFTGTFLAEDGVVSRVSKEERSTLGFSAEGKNVFDEDKDDCGVMYCELVEEADAQLTPPPMPVAPGQLAPPDVDIGVPAGEPILLPELDFELMLRLRMLDSINVEVRSRGPEDGVTELGLLVDGVFD